jgi:N-acetylglucosamine-6-sulfatase
MNITLLQKKLRLVVWSTVFLGAITFSCTPTTPPSSAIKPNIIFILSDDQEILTPQRMPKLQQYLVGAGTTFSHSFVTLPLCCPSRSTIFRGQYPHNHGVLENDAPEGGFYKFRESGLERSTIAVWLQNAGYKTALIGKYLNGYPERRNETYVPQGWNEWYSGDGFAKGVGYTMNQNGTLVPFGTADTNFATDVFSRIASSLIGKWTAEKSPFFLHISVPAPHEPAVSAMRHQGLFAGVEYPRKPSFNEADMNDKPLFAQLFPLLSPVQIMDIDALYRRRLQSLQAVDDLIESLVKKLESTGQLNNTYIVYTSDNGFTLGEHRDPIGKGTPYEENIRVPLIVRGPGVPAGRTLTHIMLNQDFAPTFAEIAGAKVPDFVDGRSFVPLLKASAPSEATWRTNFCVDNKRQFLALRTKEQTNEYAYFEWRQGDKELYQLRTDPFQIESIHAKASTTLLSSLSSRLRELSTASGEECRRLENTSLR